jgi:hypothetical protein
MVETVAEELLLLEASHGDRHLAVDLRKADGLVCVHPGAGGDQLKDVAHVGRRERVGVPGPDVLTGQCAPLRIHGDPARIGKCTDAPDECQRLLFGAPPRQLPDAV